MTTFLIFALTLALFELAAGLRMLRRDRSAFPPPPSHADWSADGLPSSPYALRH